MRHLSSSSAGPHVIQRRPSWLTAFLCYILVANWRLTVKHVCCWCTHTATAVLVPSHFGNSQWCHTTSFWTIHLQGMRTKVSLWNPWGWYSSKHLVFPVLKLMFKITANQELLPGEKDFTVDKCFVEGLSKPLDWTESCLPAILYFRLLDVQQHEEYLF